MESVLRRLSFSCIAQNFSNFLPKQKTNKNNSNLNKLLTKPVQVEAIGLFTGLPPFNMQCFPHNL